MTEYGVDVEAGASEASGRARISGLIGLLMRPCKARPISLFPRAGRNTVELAYLVGGGLCFFCFTDFSSQQHYTFSKFVNFESSQKPGCFPAPSVVRSDHGLCRFDDTLGLPRWPFFLQDTTFFPTQLFFYFFFSFSRKSPFAVYPTGNYVTYLQTNL